MDTFLIYGLMLVFGLIFSYVVEITIINRHNRASKEMINKMFDDAKSSMYILIFILSFGLIKRKENDIDEHEDI